MAGGRVAWTDHAKGIAVILVMLTYAAQGYVAADTGANWMLAVAAWARPIAFPAFFLFAGLFLHRRIFGSAAVYFDRRILRLVYFYVIWLAIQTVFLHADVLVGNPLGFAGLYFSGWVQPEGPLWFIHELVVFYVATRLLRRAKPAHVFLAAAFLQVLHAAGLLNTGWSVADHFAEYYVFFYAGYAGMPIAFKFARAVSERPYDMAGVLTLWLAVHTAFVGFGIAGVPVVSLFLGLAGTLALVGAGAALSSVPAARFIGTAGRSALPVYLGFFIPMVILQTLLSANPVIPDAGTASLVIAGLTLAVAFGFYRLVLGTPLRVLYIRPQILRLKQASPRGGSLLSSPAGKA